MGRPAANKNPKNFKTTATTYYSSNATCPFYHYHAADYICCEGQLISRVEYDPFTDCCELHKDCPQYRYLMMMYSRK